MPGQQPQVPLAHQTVQTQTAQDFRRVFGTPTAGLSPGQVAERRLRDGPNAVQEQEASWISILSRQFASPLVGLLAAAGIISFLLGETADGLTIVAILLVNGFLSFSQEFRSARSLRSLKQFLKTTATVRRNGAVLTVSREELVTGDRVVMKAGDEVPADLRLVAASDLRANESTLTGESTDVFKTSSQLDRPASTLRQCHNLVFSGTTIRRGEGEGIVIATGSRTILGSIAHLVAETQHVSAFETNLKRFSGFLLKVVAVSLGIVFLVNLLTPGESVHVSEQLLFALALAISVIPEALPAVTTITLSRGALQLARRHVVVKRLSAIEDLGQIDILCTDKTGTLTENAPAVAQIIAHDKRQLWQALLQGIPPTVRAGAREPGDPFDSALLAVARNDGHPLPASALERELPFNPELRRSGVMVRERQQSRLILRGAPETIVPLCIGGFDDLTLDAILKKAESLGRAGERVIAVAIRDVSPPIPEQAEVLERDLTFLGLVSFVDPLKPSSRRAILQAERLGVEVKIVTGDSAAVAGAVARKLELIRSPLEVMSGDQLEQLSPAEYEHAARTYRVFARMTPEQKYHLIRTLETTNSVGFLGEGINDAPALKLASVSLVVNTASDVARGAADIILLDKGLDVIVDGIKQGRTIFANVLKYVKYTLIGNFGNFFAIAGISLIVDFLPMLPAQILLTNLLTDFPLVAVAGDTVDKNELRRPPHFRLRELGFLTLTLGLVSTLFDFMFFALFRAHSPATIQTLWFTASILTELLLIYSIRTTLPLERAPRASPTLLWLTLTAGLAAVALPLTNLGQRVFHFVHPTGRQLFIILGIVLAYFIVTETVKRLYYRQYRHHSIHAGE